MKNKDTIINPLDNSHKENIKINDINLQENVKTRIQSFEKR